MTTTSRAYQGDADFWKVRDFLISTYGMNQNHHNWCLGRWGYWVYFITKLDQNANWRWQDEVRLWETDTGELVGVVNPEDQGNAFLQVHPDYRHLEGEMIEWAEAHITAPAGDGGARRVNMSVYDYDTHRQEILARRGFEKKTEWFGYKRCRSMDKSIAPPAVPEGYTVRALGPDDDLAQRCIASARAFGSQTPRSAATYHSLQAVPGYRPNLDMVAVAPDGTFVSFCIAWPNEANRIAMFEPVGTDPDHRRKGLASAVINEALRRLRTMDIERAYLGCGSAVPANALYESLGFTEADKEYTWQKVL
jgi:ribosomal protein S18 acetylase RimI-like enzyme